MMDVSNSKKKDLYTEDLVDNINGVAMGGDLSPKQIKSLQTKHDEHIKINKNIGAILILTSSHTSKSTSK